MGRKLELLLVGLGAGTRRQVANILQDSPFEASLTHVPGLADMREALRGAPRADGFDLILSENAADAAAVEEIREVLNASGHDIPLLVLSESDDARAAVDAVKAGAHDWLITHHIHQRLVPTIERALSDMRHQREAARAFAALDYSRLRYEELVEQLPQAVFEMDREGNVTFANQKGRDLVGHAGDGPASGIDVTGLIVPEDRSRAMDRITRIMDGEKPEPGDEYTVVHADGTRIPVLVYSAPIRRGDEIVGLRGVLVDRREIRETEQQLRRSEERHRRLVETMGDGLVTIDRDGTITYANRALGEMIQRPADDVLGRNVRDLLDEDSAAIVSRQIEQRFTAGTPGVYEIEVKTMSRGTLTLLITSTPLRDGAGDVIASLAVVTDITEQREAQEDLLRIKTAVDNSSDAIGITDPDRNPVYVNPAYMRMFGYDIEELREAGGPPANIAGDEHYSRIFSALDTTDKFVGEIEGRHASGRTFPVMARVDAVRDRRGQPTGFVGVFTDITRRREREERRRLVNSRLSLVNRLNQMLNAGESIDEIIATGADGIRDLLDAHHVHIFLRRPGRPHDELVLRYSNMPTEVEEDVFERPHDANLVIPLRQDTQAWEVYETGQMVEASGEDLTRAVADIETWIDAPPRYEGLAITEKLGIRYLALTPLTRGGEAMGHVTVSRTEERPLTDIEKALLEGFAQQMAVILDKAFTEREVSRLNHFLEGIINNAAVWFSVVDEDQQLIIWNRAAEQITGYSREQIDSARHLMTLLYPDEENRRRAYEYLERAFDGEELGEIGTAITRADGSQRRIVWHLRSFETGEDGTGLVVIGRDVSESHELQQQLQRVQRMDAVGTLAGGIAHDFNNVLTAIIGHADLLSDESREDGRARWHASQISQNAERASRLTRQLLAFSRKQPSRPQVVNLNRLIRDMEEMFRRVIPEDIDLRLDLSTDLGYTEIDPSQIEQIVMNLVLNARDAMPDGGELRVTTSNTLLGDDSLSELFDAAPGRYVSLQVADTGVGMDAETEAHIFEPFFTTRQAGGGTGLGLSTVYGLVRQNRGAINVYTEPGKGSLFRVYLPRVDDADTFDPEQPEFEDGAFEGDETVLVVEDADNLRELIGTILTTFGYRVFTAAQGDEALELEEKHRGELDLVVTDVVMPEMSGTELADRLLEISPDLKVLFISGYPTERAISAERTDGRYSFLQKPFSAVELGARVRALLDRA